MRCAVEFKSGNDELVAGIDAAAVSVAGIDTAAVSEKLTSSTSGETGNANFLHLFRTRLPKHV